MEFFFQKEKSFGISDQLIKGKIENSILLEKKKETKQFTSFADRIKNVFRM